ncbi:MAG: gamma-glutamyl-gamma-aminobutyrate hydrolase family protein, partial [Pseudomonadota bacterium]
RFEVTRYHSLTVKPETLPDCLRVTAQTDDGIIMGLQHVSQPLHGVQFHPESIASEHGHGLLANFLELAGFEPKRVTRERPISATAPPAA